VRGREFGAGVRAVVEATGMSQRAISDLLGWDPQKISDLLTGKGGVDEVDFARLLGVCRVSEEEFDHLMALLKVSREKGWWQFYGAKLPLELRTLIEHQDAATDLIFWSLSMVPGLLQTRDYSRAMVKVWPDIPANEVEQRVEVRIARQRILQPPRKFTFYIQESALHVPVGGVDVWVDQLHHLLRMRVRPYIRIRVLPTATGAHPGLAGSFHMMRFAKIGPVVHVETDNSSLFLEDKASISTYSSILKAIDRVALDEEESRRLITDIVS